MNLVYTLAMPKRLQKSEGKAPKCPRRHPIPVSSSYKKDVREICVLIGCVGMLGKEWEAHGK